MVQYVFTPWRNRAELLQVRHQFYPRAPPPPASSQSVSSSGPGFGGEWMTTPQEGEDVQRAIARVFMWMHRGNCPHVVESTAMLMAAIVQDNDEGRKSRGGGAGAVGGYAVRAAYLTAFTRFVTGLLDGHQDKIRKLSMYGIAKNIGLPTSFVELRHQGTHEPLPSLTQLRPAARKALVWIWDYYWRHLPEEDEDEGGDFSIVGGRQGTASSGLKERMCRAALMAYLQRDEAEVGEDAKEAMMRQLRQWDGDLVMRVLSEIGESARDSKVLLRSLKLSREILASSTTKTETQKDEIMGIPSAQQNAEEAKDDTELGWSRYQGPWTPKPIGIV